MQARGGTIDITGITDIIATTGTTKGAYRRPHRSGSKVGKQISLNASPRAVMDFRAFQIFGLSHAIRQNISKVLRRAPGCQTRDLGSARAGQAGILGKPVRE
jgi:hypothetical protein